MADVELRAYASNHFCADTKLARDLSVRQMRSVAQRFCELSVEVSADPPKFRRQVYRIYIHPIFQSAATSEPVWGIGSRHP